MPAWGLWTIPAVGKDGFRIWPKGMHDPTWHEVKAEVVEPVLVEG
jgi:hypothetical protein